MARLPFGQPVREPRLARAALVWVDLALERLHLLLTQIAETVEALGDDEAVPHLLEAAEGALRGLEWPSSTQDYVARIAPSRQQQTIWRLPEVSPEPPGTRCVPARERRSGRGRAGGRTQGASAPLPAARAGSR